MGSIKCPNCGEQIMSVNFVVNGTYDGVDFDYDEATMIATCPYCDEEIEQELVGDL